MYRIRLSMLATSLLAPFAHADTAAGAPEGWPPPMHAPGPGWLVDGDRLEAGFADGDESWAWDLQGWYGSDYNRLRWKTEGEGDFGERPGASEVQLLYSRLVHPFWEWQVGLRQVLEPESHSYLAAGVQGTAPWMIEVDAAVFIGEDGDVGMRLEAEYDLYVTQRVVLQPRIEVEASGSTGPLPGEGSGLGETALGLRLRYEVRREFAPYVGLEWERLWGGTADLARAAGEPDDEVRLLAGIRFWF